MQKIIWNKVSECLPVRRACFIAGKSNNAPWLSVAIGFHKGDGIFKDMDGNDIDWEVTHWLPAQHPEE